MRKKVEKLSDLLRDKKLVLTCAESCTGGMIAAAITDLAGSSDIFDRGFVTYSNEAKYDLLNVSTATIEDHGAVSEECVSEMVIGAIENSAADIAVAVTGIAGPTGGTPDKPVGLVYVAICIKGNEPDAVQCHFEGDRAQVRELTCARAFDLLCQAANAV